MNKTVPWIIVVVLAGALGFMVAWPKIQYHFGYQAGQNAAHSQHPDFSKIASMLQKVQQDPSFLQKTQEFQHGFIDGYQAAAGPPKLSSLPGGPPLLPGGLPKPPAGWPKPPGPGGPPKLDMPHLPKLHMPHPPGPGGQPPMPHGLPVGHPPGPAGQHPAGPPGGGPPHLGPPGGAGGPPGPPGAGCASTSPGACGSENPGPPGGPPGPP